MMLIKKICQEFRLLDIDFHLPFNKAEKLHMKWELNYPYIPWLKNSEACSNKIVQTYYSAILPAVSFHPVFESDVISTHLLFWFTLQNCMWINVTLPIYFDNYMDHAKIYLVPAVHHFLSYLLDDEEQVITE